LTAAAKAKPIPVLPEVGSISVSPGLMRPSFYASITILYPIRSFTEPPGLKNSHLAYKTQFSLDPILFNLTTGVNPIVLRILFNIIFTFLDISDT
jgi:hypothetical protein